MQSPPDDARIGRVETVAIVPCKNEAESIVSVLDDLRSVGVAQVLVCLDPRSTDATGALAEEFGATIVRSESSGYDGPVLAGIAALEAQGYEGHVLFLDGGNKYVMESVGALLWAVDLNADMTFGVRDTQLFWHQKLGNLMFSSAGAGRLANTAYNNQAMLNNTANTESGLLSQFLGAYHGGLGSAQDRENTAAQAAYDRATQRAIAFHTGGATAPSADKNKDATPPAATHTTADNRPTRGANPPVAKKKAPARPAGRPARVH